MIIDLDIVIVVRFFVNILVFMLGRLSLIALFIVLYLSIGGSVLSR